MPVDLRAAIGALASGENPKSATRYLARRARIVPPAVSVLSVNVALATKNIVVVDAKLNLTMGVGGTITTVVPGTCAAFEL